MKLMIFGIKDTKVSFRTPMYFHNTEEAKRACSFAVNSGDRNSELFICPQDFELWYLGNFDDETGHIIPVNEFILNLSDLKRINKEVSSSNEDL